MAPYFNREVLTIPDYPQRPVAEVITNGFFTVNGQWTVLYWNKAAEKLLRKRALEIVGKNLWKTFGNSVPRSFHNSYHNSSLLDIPSHFRAYWEQHQAWFEVHTYYSEDTLSLSFKSSDAHDRPAIPAHPNIQLKLLNEVYRLVLQVTNDCVWEWDLVNKELFWIDRGHHRIFGYAIENALIPQHFWESRVHPDDKERVLASINNFLSENSQLIWETEYRFKRANGEYAYVHDRGHIIYDSSNGTTRMIGATHDITDRKAAEKQLVESELKLALIAKQTINAVVITDCDQNIIWVNSAFVRITEYSLSEVIGRKSGDFLRGPDTNPVTVAYLEKQILNREPFDCTIVNYSKSRRRYWLHVQGQALLDDLGNCEQFFFIQTDVTEKVLLENKLSEERLSRQKAITSAVLVAQENERADIGREMHDNLNQILGAAKLYVELAKTDQENRGMFLEKSSDYILEVIQEIRKISKALITPVLVMGLIDSIKILINDLLLTNPIGLELLEENVDEALLSDKLQLDIFRIVQEQMQNILKHAQASQATIAIKQTLYSITLQIQDNGKGCELNSGKNGVGIMNIQSRAELCGGRMNILSAPDEGFILKVVIPIKKPQEPKQDPTDSPGQ